MSGKMTKEDSERIQATQQTGGKDMSSNDFAARAQSAGDKNQNTTSTQASSGDKDSQSGKK
ncbi:hypothetical protein FIBSPDRAFT_957760 [Athelia psychrophila]|uniref:SMP domain-containing protein n=1 Tax=Athelia psychrophila TaxID=1759441 RepID=A0A166FD56_9AGAM|nr:hypothetical protein FIBSPDRAFT_957760 [Fibularhizoctonia sp. CBS 109695]